MVGGACGERLRVDQLVLEVAHLRVERARVEALGIEVELPDHEGHQPLRVGRVVDREGAGVPQPLGLGPQDPHAGGVERRDPHHPGAVADQGRHPLLHLSGRLVGEGDREDLARLHVARRQQIADPVGEHAGLAGAGPGDDQQGRALVHHGRALLRVESLEQGIGVEPTDDLGRGLRAVRYVAGRTVNRSVEQGAHRLASLGLALADRPRPGLPACTRRVAGQAKAR